MRAGTACVATRAIDAAKVVVNLVTQRDSDRAKPPRYSIHVDSWWFRFKRRLAGCGSSVAGGFRRLARLTSLRRRPGLAAVSLEKIGRATDANCNVARY